MLCSGSRWGGAEVGPVVEVRPAEVGPSGAAEVGPSGPAEVGPSRPVEELYDCRADPQNLVNLADSREHSVALKRLRLDAVWWLVSPQNPLKPAHGMAPLAER